VSHVPPQSAASRLSDSPTVRFSLPAQAASGRQRTATTAVQCPESSSLARQFRTRGGDYSSVLTRARPDNRCLFRCEPTEFQTSELAPERQVVLANGGRSESGSAADCRGSWKSNPSELPCSARQADEGAERVAGHPKPGCHGVATVRRRQGGLMRRRCAPGPIGGHASGSATALRRRPPDTRSRSARGV
jgi:hypothetical protein